MKWQQTPSLALHTEFALDLYVDGDQSCESGALAYRNWKVPTPVNLLDLHRRPVW